MLEKVGFTKRIPVVLVLLAVASFAFAQTGTDQGVVVIDTAGSTLLIDAIPSVATRRLATDGAGLTCSFRVDDPSTLVVAALPTTIIVTCTLTEDL